MFHAKYLTSSICQFREDDFLSFNYIHIRKTYDPWASLILTLEANLKIFGTVPIDDIIY
jgi:hypothetical protein